MIWLLAVRRRVAEIRRQQIPVQALARAKDVVTLLQDTAAMDNFNNLLQMPVLFYAACLTAMQLQLSGWLMWLLAWAYVLLRLLHSVIQLGDNRVMRRFPVWMASNVLLFTLWGGIALSA